VGLAAPSAVAVNTHHLAEALEAHLEGRVELSHEPVLLGTGGALGRLRPWIDGRAVLSMNADAVHDASLAPLLEGWDGERIRFLVAGPPSVAAAAGHPARLGPTTRLCGTLMPNAAVADLPAEPCSVYDRVWRRWESEGRTEVLAVATPFFDCGTPGSYLAANLWRSGGASVVGRGAEVAGDLERCVIWPGAHVHRGEHLRDATRTTAGRTVLVRRL
jgi:MurNAc alpha-1-phosphate uridylyltransferase